MADIPQPMIRRRPATVAVTAAAIAATLLAGLENTILHPYQDSIGVWTDCTGHTGRDVVHDIHHAIAPSECHTRLMADLTRTNADIGNCIHVPTSERTRAAFIVFAFNVGSGWVPAHGNVPAHILGSRHGERPRGFCPSSVARDLNAGHPAQACAGFARYVYAGGRDCRVRHNNCYGVARRRLQERDVCLQGLQP